MSAQRRPKFPSSTQLENDLFEACFFMEEAKMAIAKQMLEFRAECLAERKRLKAEILAEAIALAEPSSSTVSPATSPCFLTYRFHKGALDVYWLKSTFSSGPLKKILRRVEQADGKTSLHVLLTEAHPDEVEAIRRHEEKARLFRAQWKEYAELMRRLKSFMDAHASAE